MAELPSDIEENELNFSDYNSDSDDDNAPRPPTSAVIAHKQIAHKEMKTVKISDAEEEDSDKDESDREDVDNKQEPNQELEFESISPPADHSEDENENTTDNTDHVISSTVVSNTEAENQTFEPISPVSDHENNFETISPPASPTPPSGIKPQFENISEDEDEEIKKPEELPEGKFSPVQESDNELNFHDESSNDSGYHIIPKPIVEENKMTEDEEPEEVKQPNVADEDDIEAPMPSPFSDIGDLDDITESDGQILSEILKDTDATEQQFEFKTEMFNEKEVLGDVNDEHDQADSTEQIESKSGPSKETEEESSHEEHDTDDGVPSGEKTDEVEKPEEEHKVMFVKESDIEQDKEVDSNKDEHEEKDEEGSNVEEKQILETDNKKEETDDEPEKDGEKSADVEVEEEKEKEKDETPEKEKEEDKKDEEEEDGEDAGDLIADIFGESDEEEEFEGFADEEMPEGDDKDESDDEVQLVKAAPPVTRTDEEEKKDESSDDEPQMPARDFVNDFDMMLEKKRAEKRIKRTRKNVDIISDNDEIIAAMIKQMKEAADEDRMLNQSGKAATKKLKMLGNVVKHIRKSDLQMTFIDCGVLSGIKEWLTPLPDHALPHIHIRKLLLQTLLEFPPLDKSALKSSGIGRAVMLLYKHPKETRENKYMAGKIISNWARPIFNVSTNFLDMSKEEREERDKKTLHQSKRRDESEAPIEPKRTKLDKDDEDNENKPRKPGDPGWCYRARVPQASNRDYVNRPVSKVDAYEQTRQLNTKKPMNRYEKHAMKMKGKKGTKQKAMDISLSGSKLGL